MKRSSTLAALVFCVVFALGACGSDDSNDKSDDGASSDAISKADFLEQGNAICAQGNKGIAKVFETVDFDDQDAVATAVKEQLIPSVQGQIDRLRALGYPEGDEDTLEGIYGDAEDDLSALEADPTILFSGDPFADTNQELIDYGLTVCGSTE